MKLLTFIAAFVLLSLYAKAQYITKYPDIPRVDVHTHVGNNYPAIDAYLAFREQMLKERKMDLAMWINIGQRGESAIDTITKASKGRIMTGIVDFRPQRGLTHKAEDIAGYLKQGYVGYKIWQGPYYRVLKEGEPGIKYLDDPAHQPVFDAMENVGMIGASVHVADPNGPFGNRGNWAKDPVEYWRAIRGMENVLKRHPKLVIVAAHGCWLVCQDAQLDYLRYMFKTYPNFYVDIAATDQYFHLVNQENLRDLFIEYSDRLLYGTDVGGYTTSGIPAMIARSAKSFQILETEDLVEGGFFGSNPTKGLNLPREALENIYYKNAARLYPGLAERMRSFGYKL
jgi:hypothetical protein